MSVERDIDNELRFHFDARIEELIRQGLSAEAARAQALEEFGDVNTVRGDLNAIDRRVARRRSRLEFFDALRQDVRYAARSLWRAPVVSLTIIATLALGLGANAAMFSLLDVIFLRSPAGVVRPDDVRLVWAEHNYRTGRAYSTTLDYAGYTTVADAVRGRADIALYRFVDQRKIGTGENAPKAAVTGASASYFRLLGIRPQLGRFYTDDEDRVTVFAPIAVVSDAFWKRELGGSDDAIGRKIVLANEQFTIIGIAQPGFAGTELDKTDVWLPIPATVSKAGRARAWWQNPNINGFSALLRLHPGASESELAQRITAALRAPGPSYVHDSLAVAMLGPIVRARGPGTLKTEVYVAERLAGVAVIVLLIACANVINLLLARALRRRREIAVRLALGVSRARLVRMLVVESMSLAVVATLAALVAATWGGSMLRGLLMPTIHFAESPLHWRVLVFGLVVAIAVGLIAGLVPAVQSGSPDLTQSLKAGPRDGGVHRSRLRSALVAFQAALSVMLLVGAVLFIRSLQNAKARDIGYTVDRVASASVHYDVADSVRDLTIPARLRALESRIASIPGVERVAFSDAVRPLYQFSFVSYLPDVDTTGKKMPLGIFSAVSPSYFSTVGMRFIRGTTFSAGQGDAVIVNHAMANAIWPGENPLGHCLYFTRHSAPKGQPAPCSRVIGVVQTAIFNSLNEPPSPQMYVSLDNPPIDISDAAGVIIRADPERLTAVQRSVIEVLRDEFTGAIPSWTTMAATMEPQYRPWKLGATLFSLFGVLALCVAGIGIYSSVSYAVSQRTHEFGVRIALGAQMADVLRQVLGEGLRTVAIGVVLGILMTVAAGRLVASLLYGIEPSDPTALGIVAAVLLVIAAIAALMPAWRAANADPVTALRVE